MPRHQKAANRNPGLATEFLALKENGLKKKQRAERLQHAQKMEAVGQLAGGVMHDFNNILMAISLGVGILRHNPEVSSETKAVLKEIERETARGANLTRQLLHFSRQESTRIESLDLNELIGDMLSMLRRLLGENIAISFRRSPEKLWVNADAGMMEQVVMNLCLNARDAMSRGGRLVLTAAIVDIKSQIEKPKPKARLGRFVCLTISDTGCGMDKAVSARIFEPFFTTKEVGKGTGLGLATACGIVREHRGWIDVISAVGEGTSFRIYLAEANPREASTAPCQEVEIRGGSEAILLVEDEPSVRRLVALWLRSLGYAILEAGDGSEALNIWEKHQQKIDLLFTDTLMPGSITGMELAVRLRNEKPSLKVISSSGYGMIQGEFPLNGEKGLVFLPKPYASETLAVTVRRCLDNA